MKPKRSKRISIKIAFLVGTVEIISMLTLFLLINFNLSKILEKKAIKDMSIIAKERAYIIETYINKCCNFLDEYREHPAVKEALQNKNNPSTIKRINELTHDFASSHENLEGLYVAEWDTFVISHTNPASRNQTFRSKENAKILEETIKRNNASFCTGIVLAPVTKTMVIPVYAPVYDENNNAIGFVGAAFYTTYLAKKLDLLTEGKNGYSLVNAETNAYIFNKDKSFVGRPCCNHKMLDVIKGFKKGKISSNIVNYKTDKDFIICYYMKDRNWVFSIEDSNENVFGIIYYIRKVLFTICIIFTLIMILVCVINIDYQMRPIQVITHQIESFKAGDYTKSDIIKKYTHRKDEFGSIATVVNELNTVLEDQHHLFFEVLEAQTVGTLVTNAEDNKIILVNQTAIKLWGIDPSKRESLSMEVIKNRFDEKEIEKIANVREIAKKTNEVVVYETSVKHDDGTVIHLLSHAKSTQLSNGEIVIIFSFIDISAQKRLEENLVILSETDSMTQICNRRSGEYKVRKAAKAKNGGMFCLFDVNKFKYVNDTFGHTVGDKVLVEISKCMKKAFRETDILIRIGGDEFVVFAPGIKDKTHGTIVLDRFMEKISEISLAEIGDHKISISLGAVLVTEPEEFSQMYAKADSLMYDCKKQGGNIYKFY